MAYGYRDSDFFFLKIKAAFPGNPRRTFFLPFSMRTCAPPAIPDLV
jgi:hypothetical protein